MKTKTVLGGLKADRHVGAFDFLLCRLVIELNTILCHVKNWKILSKGFHIELEETASSEVARINARIYPADWPQTSLIYARMDNYKGSLGWHFVEGTLSASHLGKELGDLVFEILDTATDRGFYYLEIIPKYDPNNVLQHAIATKKRLVAGRVGPKRVH